MIRYITFTLWDVKDNEIKEDLIKDQPDLSKKTRKLKNTF